MDRRAFLSSAGAVALAGSSARAGDGSGAFYDELMDKVLSLSPESATGRGLDRGPRADLKHRLDDRSAAHRLSFYDAIIDAAPALSAMPEPADPKQQIQRKTVLWLGEAFRAFRGFSYGGVGGYWYPAPHVVSQLTGAYQSVPDFLATQHTIETADDAQAYLDRLDAFAKVVDGETELLRSDAAAGVSAPGFLLDLTVAQLNSFQASQRGPAGGMVSSLVQRTKARNIAGPWGEKAQALVDGPLATAINRQSEAVKGLRAGARTSAGVGSLPQGEAYYRACLRFHTSTSLTPEEAYKLGVEQVAELSARARVLLDKHGITKGTVAQGITALSKDPAQLFPNTDAGRAQLMSFVEARLNGMIALLPKAFSRLPKTPPELRRVPVDTELVAPRAYALPGSIDGTRPGGIYFNLHDTANWPRFRLLSTVYHEGLPGHHLQGSIAKETKGVPDLFKVLHFNAYSEGWAVYAEQLADELGAYEDLPIGRLGMLQESLSRACRIVVDTGLHAQGWSRERAVAYLIEHSGSSADDCGRAIDRYCAWPGQVCGYEIGHLEFLRQRARARQALGDRFDLKGFHDAVLEQGSLPLEVMAGAVDAWVARRGSSHS